MGLELVEIIMRLEEKFGVSIEDDEFNRRHDRTREATGGEKSFLVADLVELVCGKLGTPTPTEYPTTPSLRPAAMETVRVAVREALGRPLEEIDESTRLESLFPIETRQAAWRRVQEIIPAPGLMRGFDDRWEFRITLTVWFVLTLVVMGHVLIRFDDFPRNDPVMLGGLFIACGFLPAIVTLIGYGLFRWSSPHRERCWFPPNVQTIGQLANRYVHPMLRRRQADTEVADVFRSVQAVIVDCLGVPPEEVTPDACLYRDLGCG